MDNWWGHVGHVLWCLTALWPSKQCVELQDFTLFTYFFRIYYNCIHLFFEDWTINLVWYNNRTGLQLVSAHLWRNSHSNIQCSIFSFRATAAVHKLFQNFQMFWLLSCDWLMYGGTMDLTTCTIHIITLLPNTMVTPVQYMVWFLSCVDYCKILACVLIFRQLLVTNFPLFWLRSMMNPVLNGIFPALCMNYVILEEGKRTQTWTMVLA